MGKEKRKRERTENEKKKLLTLVLAAKVSFSDVPWPPCLASSLTLISYSREKSSESERDEKR